MILIPVWNFCHFSKVRYNSLSIFVISIFSYRLVSVLLALAPPPVRREPLDEEEPSESEEELLMLSLSWPRPQEVAAQPPRMGRRLRVGELSEVVSGALLSMLAMPGNTHTGVNVIETLTWIKGA